MVLLGGFAAPTQAAPPDGLHCADYQGAPTRSSPRRTTATATVPEGVTLVCPKAGKVAFNVDVRVDGNIDQIAPTCKGISYWVSPTETVRVNPDDCDGGGGAS